MKVQPSMNEPDEKRFNPGAGLPPPELAGRNDELDEITAALNSLETSVCPSANIALIGPRGHGKTVLLHWVRTQVDRRKYNIKYTHLLSDHFKSHHDLVDALADQEIFAALAEDGFSASINLFGSGVSFSRNAAAKKLLGPVLRNKCSENGLAILIDEAHMLYRYPDTTRLFLNEAQVLAGSNRPLLLIFAGSPNISARLTNVEATFWDRLDKIGIGLLDAEAAQNALRKPLESMGYCVAADTLKNAAEAALRYHIFFNLSGESCIAPPRRPPTSLFAATKSAMQFLSLRWKNSVLERILTILDGMTKFAKAAYCVRPKLLQDVLYQVGANRFAPFS